MRLDLSLLQLYVMQRFDLKLFDVSKLNSLFSINYVKKSIRSMIEEKIIDFINAPNNSLNFGNIDKIYNTILYKPFNTILFFYIILYYIILYIILCINI